MSASSTVKDTIYSLGWNLKHFQGSIDHHYRIQHRKTSRNEIWGPLLKANKPQARFLRLVLDEARKGGPTRIIALKSRKVGISTATGGLFYNLVSQMPGTTAAVMAHQAESTGILFNIVKTMHENVPEDYRVEARSSSNATLRFGRRRMVDRNSGDHGGAYICATAGGRHPLAGSTPRWVHMSECAKFPGDINTQQNLILNVANAVPAEGPSIVIAESTANGMVGWFYETYAQASGWRDGAKSGWVPFFSSWFEDSGNRMPSKGMDWNNWPAEDREREEMLVRLYGIDQDQLAFRRWKIMTDCGGPLIGPDKFAQEYPSNEREAFLASGMPAFAKSLLDRQEENLRNPIGEYRTSIEETYEDFEGTAITGW